MAPAPELLAQLDAALPAGAVVIGSQPPDARDLDLLVRPGEQTVLEAFLTASGFVRKGRQFVRFRDCTAEAIEVVPAEALRLPDAELDALWDEASPLPGYERLLVPSPGHSLLLLARQTGRRGLTERRRRRLEAVLAREPVAWERATQRAPEWNASKALERLRAAAAGTSDNRLPPRPRRGYVVAFSGLDGSGKSTQTRALQDALGACGWDSVVIWTPLGSNAVLRALAAPARAALALARRLGVGGAVAERSAAGSSLVALPDAGPGGSGRAAVAYAWAAVVAVTNALSQALRAAPHLAAGRVVVFDRYVLDSAVHLRYLYGEEGPLALQEAVVRLISPRPLAAFYLDADPETVMARKELQYDDVQLSRQTALYRRHHARLGVRRLDSTRPLDELCAEVAESVWRKLP